VRQVLDSGYRDHDVGGGEEGERRRPKTERLSAEGGGMCMYMSVCECVWVGGCG